MGPTYSSIGKGYGFAMWQPFASIPLIRRPPCRSCRDHIRGSHRLRAPVYDLFPNGSLGTEVILLTTKGILPMALAALEFLGVIHDELLDGSTSGLGQLCEGLREGNHQEVHHG